MLSIPIYRVYIDDSVDGMNMISLVKHPAVETDFLAFSKEDKPIESKFEADEEQHIVFGCAIRANFLIYRYDNERGEYYVTFDKQTIKDLVEKYAENNYFNNVNLNHEDNTDGVYLTQMFIKDVENGIDPKGFEEIEDGSLFTAFKVNNDDVWEKVKSGEFKGFSIETTMKLMEIPSEQKMASEQPEEEDEIDKIMNEILD